MNGSSRRTINENDRRVKRTKRSLRDALFKLLSEKPFNQISVTELTDLADVNRATFYFYYDDIYDMLLHIQDEVFAQFESLVLGNDILDSTDEMEEYFTGLLNFCSENYDMCRFVLSNDVSNVLWKKIIKLITRNVPNSKKRFPADDPRCYITTYAISALIGVVTAWLNDGMKVPAEELARVMTKLYLGGSSSVKYVRFKKIKRNSRCIFKQL